MGELRVFVDFGTNLKWVMSWATDERGMTEIAEVVAFEPMSTISVTMP
jgi:hypothetical protein